MTAGLRSRDAVPGTRATRRSCSSRSADGPAPRRRSGQQPIAQPFRVGGRWDRVRRPLQRRFRCRRPSRIPACAFRISPSAQNVTPSPYGRQRPCRQATPGSSPRIRAASSAVDPALADAGFADDGHEPGLPGLGRGVDRRPPDRRSISSARPDERRRRGSCSGRRRCSARTARRVEDPDRLRLALQRRRRQLLVVDRRGRSTPTSTARPPRPSRERPTGSATPC